MALSVGVRLGPYSVTAKIGEDGMGAERRCHGNTGNPSSVSSGCTPKAFSDIDTSR